MRSRFVQQSEHVLDFDGRGNHVYHVKACPCRTGDRNQFHPSQEWTNCSPDIWIYLNESATTLDGDEEDYSIGAKYKVTKKYGRTHTHTCRQREGGKKTPPTFSAAIVYLLLTAKLSTRRRKKNTQKNTWWHIRGLAGNVFINIVLFWFVPTYQSACRAAV